MPTRPASRPCYEIAPGRCAGSVHPRRRRAAHSSPRSARLWFAGDLTGGGAHARRATLTSSAGSTAHVADPSGDGTDIPVTVTEASARFHAGFGFGVEPVTHGRGCAAAVSCRPLRR
jgi:hypothetical protein